jgi:hypothetical protein
LSCGGLSDGLTLAASDAAGESPDASATAADADAVFAALSWSFTAPS